MQQCIPEFFIIGAPKCGTTTLYDWLAEHPKVYAPCKEVCFFSQDIFPTCGLPSHIPSLEAYMSLVSGGAPQDAFCLDATPKYLYSERALSEIRRLRPDARLIVCLRDPVDLAISLHNQKLREAHEVEADFAKAWRRSISASGEAGGHELDYYKWACVGSRLKRLYETFPPDSVLVLLTRELREDPRGVYLKVLSFLGLPDDGRDNFTSKNEAVRVKNLRLHQSLLQFRRRLRPVLAVLQRLMGGRGLGFLRLVNRVNTVSGGYTSVVPDGFKREMYVLLEPEIRLAETYLQGRRLCPSSMK